MIILQNLNPGYGTFGKPYHTNLPDWLAILVIISFIITSVILYVSIRRDKKSGLTQKEIERRAKKQLLEIIPKINEGRKGTIEITDSSLSDKSET